MDSLIQKARKHISKSPQIIPKIGQANIIIIGAGGAGRMGTGHRDEIADLKQSLCLYL